MDRVGVRSIGIVSLVLLCVGAILAFQMAPILRNFGMVSRVADLISVAVFRELGPLISAIVLTGFAGASIAAEIGTMVVSEEIEALQAEGINPYRFLVLPRVLATDTNQPPAIPIRSPSTVISGWPGTVRSGRTKMRPARSVVAPSAVATARPNGVTWTPAAHSTVLVARCSVPCAVSMSTPSAVMAVTRVPVIVVAPRVARSAAARRERSAG
jgi:hypothetical protein